jgi:hypothetical protein
MAGNKMALIAADDIGKTALGIFRRGNEFIGKTVSIAGALVAGEELAAKFTAVLGEKVVYRSTPGSTSTKARSHSADRLPRAPHRHLESPTELDLDAVPPQ